MGDELRPRMSKTVYFSVSIWYTFARCFERLLVFLQLHAKDLLHCGNEHYLYQFSWNITTLLDVWLSLSLSLGAGCLCLCLCCHGCEWPTVSKSLQGEAATWKTRTVRKPRINTFVLRQWKQNIYCVIVFFKNEKSSSSSSCLSLGKKVADEHFSL